MKKRYYDIVLYKLEYAVPHDVKRGISVADPGFPRKGQRFFVVRILTFSATGAFLKFDLPLNSKYAVVVSLLKTNLFLDLELIL